MRLGRQVLRRRLWCVSKRTKLLAKISIAIAPALNYTFPTDRESILNAKIVERPGLSFRVFPPSQVRGTLVFSVNFKSYHLMLDDSILESEPVKW